MKTSIQSFVVCFMMILLSRGVSWSATIYMSTQEAKENNLTGQYIADSLDDYWISGFDPIINSTSYLYTQTPFTITGNIGTSTVILEYPQINAPTIKTSISLRNMTGSDLRGQLHTTSFPSISDASTLQDTAPKPFSLKDSFFWNEESAGSTTSKNGILFEFNQPIGGFGVRLGDVETRTDGTGVAAEVKLFDIYGNLIQTRFIQPTLGDQSTCGGSTSTSSPSECGNETTRFVGFTDNTYQVASMLIIVGDDDAGDDGFREHLSFVGPTVALEIKPGMCNTTINNSSLDTGSLPSVDTLCSQGVISGLIQTSSGRSRTCEGINTTSSSSCSLTIALPTPPTTGTGNSSSGSSNNTGSSSNGSGMTTNSGSTGNTGGNINTGSTMNTGSTITSGSITTGSSTGSSSNSSTGSSTSGSVMSGSSTQSGSSSTGNSSGTTGNSSSGSSNNTGSSSNG
ncbi:MAG TPA: hypothetical protein PK048_04960, partial [Candidatus Absconditabacterales bacterium]|nr:hypothetical protein [Candidatus Absconditabacterales bacterium]